MGCRLLLIAECRGEATLLPTQLDRHVRGERLRGGVGAGGGVRARRVGQHGQFRQTGGHLWALRQVLPVPQAPRRGAPTTAALSGHGFK